METGEVVCTLKAGGINSLAWHPSKHFLAFCTGDDKNERYGSIHGVLCSVGSGSMAHVCCRHRTDCTVQVFGYSASSSSSSSTAA